ncbi:Type II secretory pathway, ATPase PulE/Tfp pilus assembly pathway, ATPase PilB [uncultured Leptolyngbya sp.]|uniref:Type II secretory pathway, ATPase PulE/Tfp pilus assembly pathway, ATPase PilB n=1 Tax=uncultured Leptolyngbya sp. TaxID=332963 RepID=A0A6J4L177_9CYAN|nr:Type II secretory pathway, ATPase PulE/Tfp pilus assembly pathway, ATPase PilB [uncultured Leptolyngbya sp.]
MVSSQGDQIEAQTAAMKDVASPKPKVDWTAQVDTEQVFRLVDSILPFEACLYHQLLPLSLEGSRLKLGMVNLDDAAALDYVRRILAYMNCSLAPQTLSTDVHHAVLSAYLSYTGSQKQPSRPKGITRAIAQHTGQRLTQDTTKKGAPRANNTALDATPPVQDQDSHPTLLVDSPEDLNALVGESVVPIAPPPIALSPSDRAEASVQLPATILEHAPTIAPDEQPEALPNGDKRLHETLILSDDRPFANPLPAMPSVGDALPLLAVEPKHLSEPVTVLAALPPSELLVELLGRLLVGGIGRLYFERQSQHGRILWSQDGVLQSVLEALPLDVIQGVVNELKLLTHLPLLPVQKPKQVEIERLYQKQRLLLRLRVMPGTHGEEATVQVLRGAALKFYQQQQLASLSRDALTIAQNLQHKVSEIRARTRFYSSLDAEQLSVLPALGQIIKNVEQQLDALKALYAAQAEAEKNK